MRIVSYDGFTFATEGITAVPVRGLPGENRTPDLRNRLGSSAAIVGATGSGRPIPCWFYVEGVADERVVEAMLRRMIGALDVQSGEARPLVCQIDVDPDNDGDIDGQEDVSVDAIIGQWGWVGGDARMIELTFYATDNRFLYDTTETEANVVAPTAITNPSFATNTTGWTKGSDPANVTSAFTRDTGTVYDGDGGAGELDVTVNTSVADYNDIYVLNDTEFPATEGDVAVIKAWMRTTGATGSVGGIYAVPVVRFYSAADVVLQTNVGFNYQIILPEEPPAYPANQWNWYITEDTAAPATTDYFRIGVKVTATAGDTGTAFFDAFEFVTGPFTATEFEVEGTAPTHLKLVATPAGNFPQAIYAREFTLTNTGTKSLVNHPYRVDLGDNTGGDTTGTYWALLRDGKPQPCEITDYDTVQAYLWFVIGHLAPGESATYTLLLSDQTVLPGVNHVFDSTTAPAFDIGHAYVTTTSGSSATVTNIPSGLGSEIDRWIGGTMHVLTGAQAGTTIEITDSTTTSVTHAALGGGALANGVSVALFMSSNTRWVYPVRKTERSNRQRGLWWLESGQKQPSKYSLDVPGSWALDLYYDNNDVFNQKWNTPFDTGSGNDFFAIFDANRRWEGSPSLKDAGGFDGVSITLPVEITAWRFDYQWKNPNSMCVFVAGSRQENGATAWTHEFTDATPNTSLGNEAIQNVTNEADTYAVGLFVTPNGGDEIGTSWRGDDGTATSASSTTLTDSSKEWIADQYIGGTVRIVSGTGAGQTVAITDNGTDSLTVASWPGGQPDSTSRYVIRNKDYVATGRNHTYLHLTLDQSTITQSSLTAETPAYVLYRDIIINSVDSLNVETEIQRVRIAPETTGRYIVLFANESLVIDGETMRAWVEDTGDEVRTVPSQAYDVLDVAADGSRRAAPRWLWVSPGDHTVTLAAETGVVCSIDVEYSPAVYA
jgi:hypothetical protein